MGLIANSKYGDCTCCSSTNVQCMEKRKSKVWEKKKKDIIKKLENEYIGKVIGRWTILCFSYQQEKRYGAIYFKCRCSCGKVKDIVLKSIIKGLSQSCGCLAVDAVKVKLTKYYNNENNTKEYRAWGSMKTRCYNKNRKQYKDYGGRGIKVCKRWEESFDNFIKDMGKCPSKKHSLDRINNDKNYCKSNCRWATPIQQASNKSTNVMVKFNGKTKTMSEWIRHLNIPKSLIRMLYANNKNGISPDIIFNKYYDNKEKM